MWHPVPWNSTSRIDKAWGEFPRSGYYLTIPAAWKPRVVCCNNSAGLLLLTVWLLSLPKRISAKKKLQLAEATKRRKLLYTSSTQLLLLFISKHITKNNFMLAQQNILCYNTPNNKIAVVESPELDLVAPRANAEGDACYEHHHVSEHTHSYRVTPLLEVMVEVLPL